MKSTVTLINTVPKTLLADKYVSYRHLLMLHRANIRQLTYCQNPPNQGLGFTSKRVDLNVTHKNEEPFPRLQGKHNTDYEN